MLASGLALLWLALLVGLCYGIGRKLTARFAANFGERFLFSVPLGMGMVSFVLLALGLCHLFVTPVFYSILALGIPGWFFLLRDAAAMRAAPRTGDAPRDLLGIAVVAILGVIALCTLITALTPPGGLEWDALSYHLTVPKTYLREGRIFYIPYDHHSNFPFLLQMLYTLMLGVGSIGGAKLCHWFCAVLLTGSVYSFARRHWAGETGKRIGMAAALLIAASPIVIWEAGVAYVDLATALFTWLSLYALLSRDREKSDTTLLSALLMGLAIGTKLTVLGFWGIVLAGIVGADLRAQRRITGDLVKRVVLWAGVSLALAAPWLLRSYFFAGSPVYPYFYNIFGGHYWNAENAAQYAQDQATLGLGKEPLFLLLAPWLMNVQPTARQFNEYQFAFAAALVPLLLAAPLKPGRFRGTSIALALFAVVGYVFWFFLVQQTRYFLPLLPAVALLAAETLVALWESGRGIARYAGTSIVAGSALWGMLLVTQVLAKPAIRVVVGAESPSDYVKSTQWMDILLPACEWINANTPKDSKVAMFDVVFGFYIDRPILWANPNHAYGLIPWDSYATADDWLADFKRRGYTTLLTDDAFAPGANSPLSNQKWRGFLQEAIASDKVITAFETQDQQGKTVHVYRIP